MIKEIYGDLFDKSHNFDVILHGANCFHTMGAGIAFQVKMNHYEAYIADKKTDFGNINKLGSISFLDIGQKPLVVNCYTQFEPGRNFDIKALRSCLKEIKTNFLNKKIGLPQIGAGIGGGEWSEIKEVIEEETKGMDVTIIKWIDNFGENGKY